MEPTRKQEVINVCLATFTKKGLAHTPTKDFCAALGLNTGGIFYYFNTKDEIVLACAEEARKRIESDLFDIAAKNLSGSEKLMTDLSERAVEIRPLLQFFVSVCSTPKYENSVQPLLYNLGERYKGYINSFAQKLGCEPTEAAAYLQIIINAMLSYMLFGGEQIVTHQLSLAYGELADMLKKRA